MSQYMLHIIQELIIILINLEQWNDMNLLTNLLLILTVNKNINIHLNIMIMNLKVHLFQILKLLFLLSNFLLYFPFHLSVVFSIHIFIRDLLRLKRFITKILILFK